MEKCKSNNRFGVGAVLILAGLVILAANFGFLPESVSNILLSWPMILIAIGLVNLVKREFTVALILFAVGAFFILPDINPEWSFHNIWKFWPVFLILIGLSFITRRGRNHHFQVNCDTSKEGFIDEVAVFGGRVAKIETSDFKGGKVTCVFGGTELHLEKAIISDKGALLDIAAIFGGVKIIVPKEWNVKVEVTSVFGGFVDKRMFATDQNTNNKTLVIKGTTVFGGGELTNS